MLSFNNNQTSGPNGQTNNNDNLIFMLKAFSILTDPQTRCRILLLIKIIELRQCLENLNNCNDQSCTCTGENYEEKSIMDVLASLKDELPPQKRESMEQIFELMQTMELYKDLMNQENETDENVIHNNNSE